MNRNRIPNEFFLTRGKGDSDLEIHAGSYHMALYDAGISNYNIISYSSVLPATAREVDFKIDDIPFGSELNTIISVNNGEESEFLSAGIAYGWLYDEYGIKLGGLACEVSGNYPLDELEWRLNMVINDLHSKTYSKYNLRDIKLLTNSFIPQKRYGTVLVAMCFRNFL
jgi:arginine decarboxylase